MYTLQNYELDVYVISLPRGKDPDELLNSEGQEGKELFDAALAEARPLVLQHLHTVRPLLDDPATRLGGMRSLFEGLSQLQPAMIAPYVPQLAATVGFYPDHFWREWERFRRGGGGRQEERSPEGQRAVKGGMKENEQVLYDPLEAALCAMLWRDDECRRSSRPEEILSLIADSRVKEIALAILLESPHELETRWHTMNERFPLAFIARGDSFCEELEFARDADPWSAICEALQRKRVKERMDCLDERMKRDEATLEEMAEFQRIAAQLKSGKKAKTSA
jgi:DNA primase